MVHDGIVDVRDSSHSFLVDDQLHLLIADAVLSEEAFDEEARAVAGGVVDDDHVVVLVLLVEDRLQVELESEVLCVFIARNYDAEGQFGSIFAQVVDLL